MKLLLLGMLSMLNINGAMELYSLLSDYLPAERSGTVLDFVGKIIDRIAESEQPENFAKAIQLMYGYDIDKISTLDGIRAIELFTDGLLENQIITLAETCKSLGFNDG